MGVVGEQAVEVEWDGNQEFGLGMLNLRCLLDIQSRVLEKQMGFRREVWAEGINLAVISM